MQSIIERFEECISLAKQNGLSADSERRMRNIFFAGAGCVLTITQEVAEMENKDLAQEFYTKMLREVDKELRDAVLSQLKIDKVH